MKSLAPKKSQRPRSREDALNQRRLDMPADYSDGAPETPKRMRPKSREEGMMNLKLKSISRSDQGTTDAKRFKNGGMVSARGCGDAVSGKKFSGTY